MKRKMTTKKRTFADRNPDAFTARMLLYLWMTTGGTHVKTF